MTIASRRKKGSGKKRVQGDRKKKKCDRSNMRREVFGVKRNGE